MMLTARIKIMPKTGILDPQGQVILHSLESLGFQGVDDIRVGKMIEMKLDHPSRAEAERSVAEMCRKLLANPNIESFEVDVS